MEKEGNIMSSSFQPLPLHGMKNVALDFALASLVKLPLSLEDKAPTKSTGAR